MPVGIQTDASSDLDLGGAGHDAGLWVRRLASVDSQAPVTATGYAFVLHSFAC